MTRAGSLVENHGSPRPEKSLPRGAVILLYHRVADLETDPQRLAVSPPHFAEHLDVLRRYHRPTALSELRRRVAQRDVPDDAVVVTFDDGYADNLEIAKPMLERADVPATVFVATGYLDAGREFWWDELENLLLQAGTLPRSLTVPFEKGDRRISLDDVASYGERTRRRYAGWNVTQTGNPTIRHELYRDSFEPLKTQPHKARLAWLDRLWDSASRKCHIRNTHRPLSPDQVVLLGEGGLIEIGAHTVTHPVLSKLSPAEQREEIQQSRTRLQELLHQPVESFSYPFGTRRDYTPETVALVRQAGFACACSNFAGPVGSDVFQWPRTLVRDFDGETLLKRLDEVRCRA